MSNFTRVASPLASNNFQYLTHPIDPYNFKNIGRYSYASIQFQINNYDPAGPCNG